jgi:vacuolar-type H+-ATPase subunit H
MAKTKQANQTADVASSGDLGVLIEAERMLEARLDGIQGEAKGIVSAAQNSAQEADQQLEVELKETAKRLRAEMEAEQKHKLAQINQDFERQAVAFDTTSAAKVDEVAAHIAGLLLEGGSAGEAANPGARA